MQRESLITNLMVEVKGDDGGFDAYVAEPQQTGPAVIVVSSILGVTPGLREDCDELARRGFLAIAPDLFWRTHAGPLTREQHAQALARYEAFDVDGGIDDLRATIAYAQGSRIYNGRCAILGYCFGGRYAVLGAARLGIDAGVSFHGTAIGESLNEAPSVNAPLSLHFAELDDLVTMTEVEAIREAFSDNEAVEVFTYPGVHHGFAQRDASRYDKPAGVLAMQRSMRLLSTLFD